MAIDKAMLRDLQKVQHDHLDHFLVLLPFVYEKLRFVAAGHAELLKLVVVRGCDLIEVQVAK